MKTLLNKTFQLRMGLVGLVFILSLSGCTAARSPQLASANVVSSLSGEIDSSFARAYEPITFDFPIDHGAHPQYKTEWWYYTGNLTDEAGNAYGYQLTFFRSGLSPQATERQSDLATNQIYMAHFALTDGNAQSHHSFERFSRGAELVAGATGEERFAVWLEDWSVSEVASGEMQVIASAENSQGRFAVDLLLQETRTPLLHGDAGLSQKGPEPGNASYYYSLVGLTTTGTIVSGGDAIAVAGKSWMDHEFGTSALSENAVGWDWFSVQLENGAALAFAQIRTDDEGTVPGFEGTYAAPDGTHYPIGHDDFLVEPIDAWTSPQSGFTYPSGWQVRLPAYDLVLMLDPLVLDQEMDVSFIYWEGAVTVTGTANGEPVQGVGYVELTGYGQAAGSYQR